MTISVTAAALVATPVVADAADPGRPPDYRARSPIAMIYDWTGFYAGAHIGAASDDGTSGFLGGGQVGFNYQVGRWVFGVEGDLSATSISNSASVALYNGPYLIGRAGAEASLDWISTFAARAGWAFDRWLVYGKLGGAWAHVSYDAFAGMGDWGVSVSADKTVSGWMLGLGAEYALRDNWTAKVEYNMLDLGGSDNTHLLKAGVNYRFGFDPRRR